MSGEEKTDGLGPVAAASEKSVRSRPGSPKPPPLGLSAELRREALERHARFAERQRREREKAAEEGQRLMERVPPDQSGVSSPFLDTLAAASGAGGGSPVSLSSPDPADLVRANSA